MVMYSKEFAQCYIDSRKMSSKMNSQYNRRYSLVGHNDETSEHDENAASRLDYLDRQRIMALSKVREQYEDILQTLLMMVLANDPIHKKIMATWDD